MAFDSLKARWRGLWSVRRPVLPPPRRSTSTALKPFALSAPAAGPPLSPADMKRLRDCWTAHAGQEPRLTAERFLDVLEARRRYFAEERRALEGRLAQLNANLRPLP
jgi:hypothetical protein